MDEKTYQLFKQWHEDTYPGKAVPPFTQELETNPQFLFWANNVYPATQTELQKELYDKLYRAGFITPDTSAPWETIAGLAGVSEIVTPQKTASQALQWTSQIPAIPQPPPLSDVTPVEDGGAVNELEAALRKQAEQIAAATGGNVDEIYAQLLANTYGYRIPDKERDQLSTYELNQMRMAELETEKYRKGAEMDIAGAERQRLVNMMSGRTEGDIQRQRAAMWDEIRANVMSSIKDVPSEWLNYKQLEIAQNPYSQETTPWGDLSKARENSAQATEILKEAKQREDIARKDPNISLTAADKAFIEFAESNYQAATDVVDRAYLAAGSPGKSAEEPWTPAKLGGYQQTDQGMMPWYSVGEEAAPKPVKGVATPAWMERYASQLRGKQWIPGTGNVGGELTEVSPLSGQAAQRLSPTQLEMMKGLAKFSGQEPSDWLYQASVQTPKNISLGRTWGGF